MIAPRYLVRKAPGVGGNPIPEDEPVLVIRAQDRLAAPMMRHYIDTYSQIEGHDEQVVAELNAHHARLVAWQETHPVKTADR